jgi:hypothetical protein
MGLQNLEDLCLELGVTIVFYQSKQRPFLLQNWYGNILPSREDCGQKFSLIIPINLMLLLFVCSFLLNNEPVSGKDFLKLSETDLFCYLGIQSAY